MTKRAAIIITDDVGMLFCDNGDTVVAVVNPSEQLLADLHVLANPSQYNGVRRSDAAARMRALLPKEEDEGA